MIEKIRLKQEQKQEDNLNLDEEKLILSKCVIKIISMELDIKESLILISKNSKIYTTLCDEIGLRFRLTEEKINEIKKLKELKIISNDYDTKLNNVISNKIIPNNFFDKDLINFINNYNQLYHYDTIGNILSIKIKILYEEIKKFVENNILNNINESMIILEQFDNIKKICEKYKSIYSENIEKENDENINMFYEDKISNYIKNWKNYNNIQLKDLIDCYCVEYNEFYKIFYEIKEYMPIMFNFLINLDLEKSYNNFTFPFLQLKIGLNIVNEEYNKIKFEIV